MQIQNNVFIITGGASGLGAATARMLVEAGATLNGALMRAGWIDELLLYIAPQLLGDAARGLAALGELTKLDQRVNLDWQDVRQVGKDLRIVVRRSITNS